MRNTIVNYIFKRAKNDKNIFLVVPDLGYSVVDNFFKDLPNQIINVGIAEQNAIGIAAGLALTGKKVFIYSIAPFVTMRCFEQIRVDLAYQKLDVTIIGVGGGFAYGTLGTTHHALEDFTIMRSLPGMKIFSPSGPQEAEQLIGQIIEIGGPAYIRLNRGGEPDVYRADNIIWDKITPVFSSEAKILILATGAILDVAVKASQILFLESIPCDVSSVHTIKPIDSDYIREVVDKKDVLITLEEHNILGGLGEAVAGIIAEAGSRVKFKKLGVNDFYPTVVGKQDYLRDLCGLSPEKVANTIKDFYEKK